MDVNFSKCFHCETTIHYSEARLLPEGGGVCHDCAERFGYERCEECGDYFVPKNKEEHFCELCFAWIFAEF